MQPSQMDRALACFFTLVATCSCRSSQPDPVPVLSSAFLFVGFPFPLRRSSNFLFFLSLFSPFNFCFTNRCKESRSPLLKTPSFVNQSSVAVVTAGKISLDEIKGNRFFIGCAIKYCTQVNRHFAVFISQNQILSVNIYLLIINKGQLVDIPIF